MCILLPRAHPCGTMSYCMPINFFICGHQMAANTFKTELTTISKAFEYLIKMTTVTQKGTRDNYGTNKQYLKLPLNQIFKTYSKGTF